MSDQEKGNGGARERLKEEFAGLPLDKKFASLFELEMVALNESISYVVNSSGDIFNKVADVVNDFSRKVECEFKKGTANAGGDGESSSATDHATESGGNTPDHTKEEGGGE